tara:strand:- start:356 stop:955 length:600 start_codon:yes stop_codon:yes gene_type:complete
MATAISSLPNEVSKNQVVSMAEKNVEAAVNMKIANPPKQEPVIAPSAPTELSQQSINQIVAGLQQAQGATGLPSRDLPTNSNHITQDEQIQPNYIPKPENTNYIENDQEFETLIEQSKHKKVEQDRLDVLYDELQTPVIVMILFFFFQLPIFQKTLSKNLPSLFTRDGNPSFSGYLFKTVVFGTVFYGLTKLTKQISQI